MYTCSSCGHDYPFLILEFDYIVCEKCSLLKNLHPSDLNYIQSLGETLEVEEPVEEGDEDEEEGPLEIDHQDVQQLMNVIDKIANPRIRSDFFHLAKEYLSDIE